jgi:thiol-disulfide isomerase/thioredoxin
MSIQNQAQDFVRELDVKSEKPLLKGQITFENLLEEASFSWLPKGVKAYEPNDEAIKKLTALLPKYKIVAFIGTWCEDTHNVLPSFYKTMQLSLFDFNALDMYGVNRDKKAINAEHQIYNISKVPTFIVMDRFREVGRITESVNESIEVDLLDILERDIMSSSK